MRHSVFCGIVLLIAAASLDAQNPPVPPPGFGPRAQPNEQPQPAPAKPNPAQAQPATAGQTAPTTQPAQPVGTPTVYGGLSFQNASLTEVIDLLARQLKLNYILDPRVKGGVYLNTYGDTKAIAPRELLDTILSINGFAMIQVGDLWRIMPAQGISHLPMKPEQKVAPGEIPNDDAPMLNLVFLKYAQAEELVKVLNEFKGESGQMIVYPPANLIFILDTHRNMRRTMELIAMFDSSMLANQRVRLFELRYGRPSDVADEMKTILKSISLGSDKNPPVRFLPVDRINTLIAVAPNPGAFEQVEIWLKKLDIPLKSSGNATDTFVYRVKYQRAECIAQSLMQLYGTFYSPAGMNPYGGMGGGMYGGGFGGGYGGGGGGYGAYGAGGGGGYGGINGGGGTIGGANAGLGVGGGCGGGMGMGNGMGGGGYGMGGGGYGMGGGGYGNGGGYAPQYPMAASPFNGQAAAAATGTPGAPADLTGNYLGNARQPETQQMPRIVPNPGDNSLLIQATQSQYQSLVRLLDQLDIPPRQILLEMKLYQVTLTGDLKSGVAYFLEQKNGPAVAQVGTRQFLGTLANGGVSMTAGMLIGHSRELLGALSVGELATRAKVVAAPSLIATDSIPASITVGDEIPTLTSQAAGNIQVGGSSAVLQGIQNRQTGVTLNVMARVNPSGIVTLIINQDFSQPGATTTSGIGSPSFSNRTVQTQLTMQDGDTIAIGGIISDTQSFASNGLPGLHRLPYVGALFGSREITRNRTELIVFMTPHIIYDNNDLQEASDELKGRVKMLKRTVRE